MPKLNDLSGRRFERKCKECGKLMTFQWTSEIRTFCSKACYNAHRKKMYTIEDDGPAMLPLDKDSISDDGFTALVAAIIQQAKDDVVKLSPGTPLRVDAEKFFRSEYFAVLTNLDGETILRKLEEEYKRKHRRKKTNQYATRMVRCVETDAMYGSLEQAGAAYNVGPSAISYACRNKDATAAGMHFEYVEG